MRCIRMLSVALVICLLLSAMPAAVSEEALPGGEPDGLCEGVEAEASDAASVPDDTGLSVEQELPESGEEPFPEAEEALPAGPEQAPGGCEVSAPVESMDGDLAYARVAAEGATLYCDAVTDDALACLAPGEVVLVTGADFGRTPVAVNAGGSVVEGYMAAGELAVLDGTSRDAYLDAASAGEVALYDGDINWPLSPLGDASAASLGAVMASANYKDLGNDTKYTINGKEIYANQFPDTGSGRCWTWAQMVYKELWGCNFSSDFEGKAATGLNLVRNLGDADRLLTPDHLRYFIQNTVPGATLRVCSCTSDCSHFSEDGLSCGHKGHSLIVVDKNADGVFTMDSHSNSQHTRFYSWQGFCNSWKNYTYVKYIKWPNAPALAPSEVIDGVPVGDCSATYRVRATAADGVKVWSAPSNGTVVETLAYPATFAASKRAISDIDGLAWVHGVTAAGSSGWIALDGSVADINDAIAVTGVALSASKLAMLVGGTASLTAAVQPIDATNAGVSWASSDAGVVTVDGGALSAVAAGTATITVTTADGGKTAECLVQVAEVTRQKALTKTGSNGMVKLAVGQKLQLTADFATNKKSKVKSVKSSKTAVASVDKAGVVTAKAAGKTTITVVAKNGKKATLTVQVIEIAVPATQAEAASAQKALTKTGSNGSVTLSVGQTLQLVAEFATKKGWKVKGASSSKAGVASIDKAGVVTALAAGKTTITVTTKNKKKAKLTVNVTDPNAPTGVTLNRSGTVKLKKGKTLQLTATVEPATAVTKLAWKSSKAKVATVDETGKVTAVGKGTCYVGVITENGKYQRVKIVVS